MFSKYPTLCIHWIEVDKSEYSHAQIMYSATSAPTYKYQTALRHKKQAAVSTAAVITPDVTESLGRVTAGRDGT
jgi:short-subunit dehydrogenase involved in D-alanine esterification of teichoic acids